MVVTAATAVMLSSPATAEPGAQGVPAAGEPPMTALPVRMVRQDCFSAELTDSDPGLGRTKCRPAQTFGEPIVRSYRFPAGQRICQTPELVPIACFSLR